MTMTSIIIINNSSSNRSHRLHNHNPHNASLRSRHQLIPSQLVCRHSHPQGRTQCLHHHLGIQERAIPMPKRHTMRTSTTVSSYMHCLVIILLFAAAVPSTVHFSSMHSTACSARFTMCHFFPSALVMCRFVGKWLCCTSGVFGHM